MAHRKLRKTERAAAARLVSETKTGLDQPHCPENDCKVQVSEKTAPIVRLSAKDNVGVARKTLRAGDQIETLRVQDDVAAGHKVAMVDIPKAAPVMKYGQIIGYAAEDISAGCHVHSHNLAFSGSAPQHEYCHDAQEPDMLPEEKRAVFHGFHREDGRVGTRNYVAVLSSVNCSATVASFIARSFTPDILARYPNVDGVVSFVHGTGCGMADSGEGFENLQRVLWGYSRHPNIGGVLLVGLGCEVNQIDFLLEAYGLRRGVTFQTMNIQAIGGLRKTIGAGVAKIREMLPQVNRATRKPAPVSALMLGLQCGGSDGWSGITANPALGYASDLLVRQGGTSVLAETPEVYGAEHLLTGRAADKEIARKLVDRLGWWEEYAARSGGSMDNNPSPGNKRGGLTTILEKSLGAVAKSGTTRLNGVYKYAEPIDQKGFVFMDSPGYDPASVTGQIASGCNLICFTTGRGSAFGSKPAPTIKIATNTALFDHMTGDMDINAGRIISDGVSIAQVGQEIFETILAVASGQQSCSEAQGLGDHEFVPWQIGATM